MGLLTKNQMEKRQLRLGYYRGVSQKENFSKAKPEPPLAQMPPVPGLVKEQDMVRNSPRVQDMKSLSPNTRGVIDSLLQGSGVRGFGVRNFGSGTSGGSISTEQVFSQSARV